MESFAKNISEGGNYIINVYNASNSLIVEHFHTWLTRWSVASRVRLLEHATCPRSLTAPLPLYGCCGIFDSNYFQAAQMMTHISAGLCRTKHLLPDIKLIDFLSLWSTCLLFFFFRRFEFLTVSSAVCRWCMKSAFFNRRVFPLSAWCWFLCITCMTAAKENRLVPTRKRQETAALFLIANFPFSQRHILVRMIRAD